MSRDAKSVLDALGAPNAAFSARYPGESPARQPVHTVYGGAHLYRADTTTRLGELALRGLSRYAKSPFEFASDVGFVTELQRDREDSLRSFFERDPVALQQSEPSAWLAFTVHDRVIKKLEREPVEDFRIDFEDGFGVRSDQEEDDAARAAARELAAALTRGSVPPFVGIRTKSLGEEWKHRAARTLELFVSTLLEASGGRLPEPFIVTLPKITIAEQARALVHLLERLEEQHGLPPQSLKIELMIEVTQALFGPDGRSPLPAFLDACGGRCFAAHLGTYDYTASCNITAAYQKMDHPMCDLAKGLMKLAYASTGIFLSDGATNVLPVGPYPEGTALTDDQAAENDRYVRAAWQLSHRHIRHSLEAGFYQGWDLHPMQLPVRYASCYAFFLEGLAQAAERLKTFVERAALATLVGGVFDDAATGQGLLNYFSRARNCGAIELAEIERTGLTMEEFGLRSFAKILQARNTRLRTTV